ncbi:MAG: hypothetical protein K2J41_08020, partial [Eubacterium sp.]|nr:hypothetical protein [Eubacterium sp.]
KIGGAETISYTYDDSGNLVSENYANGSKIRYKYNDDGYVTAQYRDNSTSPYVTFAYSTEGELIQKINYDSDLKYTYGENGSFEAYRMSDNTLVQSYSETVTEADEEQGIEAQTDITETHFGTVYSSVIKGNSISYATGSDTLEYGYNEDDNGTIVSDYIKYNRSNILSSEYTYNDNSDITKKSFEDGKVSENTYDNKGRITSTQYGGNYNDYEYDNNNQVTYFTNYDIVADYSYDERGNITYKQTTGEEELYFCYDNDGWTDKITEINNVSVSYDENGNILGYGSRCFNWYNGRQLESVYDSEIGLDCSYTYDENGIRTSKTVNGVTTYYNTRDGVILSQTDGTNTMYFQYDESGVPIGYIYNDIQIFYRTNQNGDVIGLVLPDGTVIANYNYDAWGNTVSINVLYDWKPLRDIAEANPIRYRGYYLDTETNYYYLQSRYYDPSICRFINADIPNIAQQYKFDVNGLNIFAYCCNNPINNADPEGYYNYTSLGKKGIKLFSKQMQNKINEMKKHNYKGFSSYGGKIQCVSAIHYTAYWYGTTLRYDLVTYEATVKNWYSYMDAFKKAVKKAGIVQSVINSSTFAILAKKIIGMGRKAVDIVIKAISITMDILIEIKQGVLDT